MTGMSKDDLCEEDRSSHRDHDHHGHALAPARALTLAPALAQPRSYQQAPGERAGQWAETWEAEMG